MSLTELDKKKTEVTLEKIKESLLLQKSHILNKSYEFKTERISATQLSDESEQASKDFDDNLSINLHERDRMILISIERALAKISSGHFGQCDSCGQDIGLRRLQARPFAELCIECMEEKESQNTLQ